MKNPNSALKLAEDIHNAMRSIAGDAYNPDLVAAVNALAGLATVAAEPVGEPVATVFQGSITPWGQSTLLQRWEAGAGLLSPGEHKLYAAPQIQAHPSPSAPVQTIPADVQKALEWLDRLSEPGFYFDRLEPLKKWLKTYPLAPVQVDEGREPLTAAEAKLNTFLAQFDLDGQEKVIRYALDHIVPAMKARRLTTGAPQ